MILKKGKRKFILVVFLVLTFVVFEFVVSSL